MCENKTILFMQEHDKFFDEYDKQQKQLKYPTDWISSMKIPTLDSILELSEPSISKTIKGKGRSNKGVLVNKNKGLF